MTAQHDDLIRAFIAEGRDELPDRAFDAVRGDIHRTRQRVVVGPWREPHMSNLAKAALAAAAVIAVLFGASRLLPSTPGPGGTPPPPTPSPSQSATPTESGAPSVAFISPGPICDTREQTGPLEPGTYSVSNEVATLVPYTVEVPAGWTLFGGCIVANGESETDSDVLFMTWNVSHIFPTPASGTRTTSSRPEPRQPSSPTCSGRKRVESRRQRPMSKSTALRRSGPSSPSLLGSTRRRAAADHPDTSASGRILGPASMEASAAPPMARPTTCGSLT